jgi:hypothetical protein
MTKKLTIEQKIANVQAKIAELEKEHEVAAAELLEGKEGKGWHMWAIGQDIDVQKRKLAKLQAQKDAVAF